MCKTFSLYFKMLMSVGVGENAEAQWLLLFNTLWVVPLARERLRTTSTQMPHGKRQYDACGGPYPRDVGPISPLQYGVDSKLFVLM